MKKRQREEMLIDQSIDTISFFMFLIAILSLITIRSAYLYSTEYKHVSSDATLLIYLATIALISIILSKLIFAQRLTLLKNKFNFDEILDYVLCSVSYISIQIVVSIIRNAQLFQTTTTDIYAFYVSAAVVEEFVYRLALISVLQAILVNKMRTDINSINLLLILISAAVFAAVHIRYYTDPYLMILTFMGGASQAFFYLKTKNIFPCLLSHSLINFMAAGSLIQTLGV